ncbi:hypothetical protein D3C87_1840840 [compost metagenome]
MDLLELLVDPRKGLGELGAEALGLHQVHHPEAPPQVLVAVGRADAAAGGADPVGAALLLEPVEQLVVGHDDVRQRAHRKVVE